MSKDTAARHYLGEAGARYHGHKRAIPDSAVPWVSRLRAEKIAPHISSNDVVFEFGVGSGWNLSQLQCAARLGYDVSSFLAKTVEDLGIKFVTDLSQISGSSIDIVLCHHTLEHLKNPAANLETMRTLLRPGGKLLLFVPFEKERRYRNFTATEPNHHLFSWNVQTLGNLVEETGFKFVSGRIARFGYDRFAAAWATRLKIGEAGFRLMRATLHALRPAWEVRIVAEKSR
jgi:SAM-dependent methyltransferase